MMPYLLVVGDDGPRCDGSATPPLASRCNSRSCFAAQPRGTRAARVGNTGAIAAGGMAAAAHELVGAATNVAVCGGGNVTGRTVIFSTII